MAIDKIILQATDNLFTNTEIGGTEAARMPVGTTAQRANAQAGDLRFNTTIGKLEQYDGSGWSTIDAPPSVQSISPSSIPDSSSSFNITITGSNFSTGAVAAAIGQDGSEISASSTSRTNNTQLVATFDGTSFNNAQENYSVKVTNSSGLAFSLADSLAVNASPTWTTSSGNLATIWDNNDSSAYSTIATVAATDPEGGSISYSETTSVLSGAGLSLNSTTGVISATDPTDVSNQETKTFTIGASDGSNTTTRSFNIIVNPMDAACWYKSENIADSGSTITWANSGTEGSSRNMTMFGSYSQLQYRASDSGYNNNKTIDRIDGTTRAGLSTSSQTNIRPSGEGFTLIAVGQQDTDTSGGNSLGESMMGWHNADNTNDGSWMLDMDGDHSWGGSYGEFRGSSNPPLASPRIVMWRWAGGSGGAWKLNRQTLSGSTFTQIASGTSNEIMTSNRNRFVLMDVFTSGGGVSHHFDGRLAEVIWIRSSISDTVADYWRDYLKEKFA